MPPDYRVNVAADQAHRRVTCPKCEGSGISGYDGDPRGDSYREIRCDLCFGRGEALYYHAVQWYQAERRHLRGQRRVERSRVRDAS